MNKRVFISHASEDKDTFVRCLAKELTALGMDIWYDEYEIKPGMSIRASVDNGLACCDAGIVILSKSFLSKKWTIWELNGLVQKMLYSNSCIIPIWLNITYDEILKFSPSLADILAISASSDYTKIAKRIFDVLYPTEPVLVTSKSILSSYGFSAPDYYDDWWIDSIEFIARDSSSFPWALPINPINQDYQLKSYKLAWAGMRLNWIKECHELKFCQFTDPEIIVDKISRTPGMEAAARKNIDYLVLYAPQLCFHKSIFSYDIYKEYSNSKIKISNQTIPPSYTCTISEKGALPSCNRLYALMDENFGSYLPQYLLQHFVVGESLGPSPNQLNFWAILIMLCSSLANIYPSHVRDILICGYKSDFAYKNLSEVLVDKNEENLRNILSEVRYIERVVSEVIEDYDLNIPDDPSSISEKILRLELFKYKFPRHLERLTIPTEDLKLGFRGLNFQERKNNDLYSSDN